MTTLTSQWTIEGDRFLPQAYIDMSLVINRVYPNIEIGMLRNEAHINEGAESHPFCLMLVNEDGSVQPVRYLKELDMNLDLLMGWLDANNAPDKTADQHFNEYLEDLAKKEIADKKIRDEKTAEEADLLSTIYTSKLHTFRHNGNKIGSDNNRPTLQLQERQIL